MICILIQYDLQTLRTQLIEMRYRITCHPLFESGWIDRMPGDIIQ